MWKECLMIGLILCVNGILGGKRVKSDSKKEDCERTNGKAFQFCTKSCLSDKECGRNRKCLCDGDCGLSCVRTNLKCPKPPKTRNSNRRISNQGFLGSVVTYSCKSPYTLRGSANRTCRAIGKWDGKNARCRIVCPDPGSIPYGNYNVDGLQAGRFVQYWCFPGYKLKGSATITCQNTGKWSSSKPQCILNTCDEPPVPKTAQVTFPRKFRRQFSPGESVHLKCKDGYFNSGSVVMICKRDKSWNGRIQCLPKSCGKPREPKHGVVVGYVFSFQSKVQYKCDNGYELKGPAYRICQANEEWSGTKPTCEVVDCGHLEKPVHGQIIEQVGTTFGNRIVFRCIDKGYEIKGSAIRTCQSDGSWSGPNTTCELVECGDPGRPVNGRQIVSKGYVYGGSVLFVCDRDYTLQGHRNIYCQVDKTWGGSVPKCLAPCEDPGDPYQGGRIVEGFRHDQTITFTCPKDYFMEGEPRIKCSNGQWNHGKPSCKAPCGEPNVPQNGWKSGRDYTHGKSVRVGCHDGFKRTGNDLLTCDDGKWNKNIPVCKGMCRKLYTTHNMIMYGSSFLEGDEVTFSCRSGYDLFGRRTLRCVKRRWDAPLPQCKARCRVSRKPDNGYYYGTKQNEGYMLKHGVKITYGCNIGYTMEGDDNQQCENGRWSNDAPRCRANCRNPGGIAHGRMLGDDFSHGKSVEFFCDGKYSLEGESRLTCNDGNWNFEWPKCKVSCPDPGSPFNGKRQGNNFRHNSRMVFSCDPTYRLVGTRTIVCNGGSWSNSLPKCIVLCPNPGTPVNGERLGNDFLDGKTVTFQCMKGYEMQGKKTIQCKAGVWNDTTPECKGRCKFPGNPRKGYEVKAIHVIGQMLPHGSHIKYACEPRYAIVGSNVLHCNDGVWNASIPSCKAPCVDPGFIHQGVREGNDLSHGQTLTFNCTQFYTLVGSRQLTCVDGKWDSVLPQCKGICANPGSFDNGVITGEDHSFGSSIRFSCNAGYELRGAAFLTCNNGVWSGEIPECKGCIRLGSTYWGMWAWNERAFNYYKVQITNLNERHLEFRLQKYPSKMRKYNTTDPVLVIDNIPTIDTVPVNAKVIALHRTDRPWWFRSGRIERIVSLNPFAAVVRFDDNNTRLVSLQELRLIKRPELCMRPS